MSAAVTACIAAPNASCNASTVRVAVERSNRFTFDQIGSIGFLSDDYGGIRCRLAPGDRASSVAHAWMLVDVQVIHHDPISAALPGEQRSADVDLEQIAVHRAAKRGRGGAS